MKLMKTEDAVGQVLCHDITQIIKGVTKDAVFRKGHIITEEDIPVLLSVGKDNIYIWEKDDTMLHENEAAQILYDMCKNDHMHPSDVKEGKIELIADCDGLLKVDREKLKKVSRARSAGRMRQGVELSLFPAHAAFEDPLHLCQSQESPPYRALVNPLLTFYLSVPQCVLRHRPYQSAISVHPDFFQKVLFPSAHMHPYQYPYLSAYPVIRYPVSACAFLSGAT